MTGKKGGPHSGGIVVKIDLQIVSVFGEHPMSNEFLERLNSGSLTQIEQYRQMRINLAPAIERLAGATGVADDWKDWELAPEWSADVGAKKQAGDEDVIDGAQADSLRDALSAIERND